MMAIDCFVTLSEAGVLFLIFDKLGNHNLLSCFFATFLFLFSQHIYQVYVHLRLIHSLQLVVMQMIMLAPFITLLAILTLGVVRKSLGGSSTT